MRRLRDQLRSSERLVPRRATHPLVSSVPRQEFHLSPCRGSCLRPPDSRLTRNRSGEPFTRTWLWASSRSLRSTSSSAAAASRSWSRTSTAAARIERSELNAASEWGGAESDRRHRGFQPRALPTELPPRTQVSEPSPTRSPSAPDGLRSRDLLLDREVRTTGLLYGRICSWCRAPNGIRTRASALKGRCPRPLDDGGLPFAIFPSGTAERV
jgi:hypothetical protein